MERIVYNCRPFDVIYLPGVGYRQVVNTRPDAIQYLEVGGTWNAPEINLITITYTELDQNNAQIQHAYQPPALDHTNTGYLKFMEVLQWRPNNPRRNQTSRP